MTFWVQHGYGKADKIEAVANTGLLAGVILSPADEDRPALESTAQMIHRLHVGCMLDPQLYIHTIPGAVARCHESNSLDFSEIIWDVSPGEISDQVREIVTTNEMLGMRSIIAPSPYQASFGDAFTPLSLQYARETIDATDRAVYMSLVAEDSAFGDWDSTLRYLSALTRLDAAGIYLIVGSSGKNYPILWDREHLANILRVVYTLAEYNDYRVVWGYSDVAGVLGLAVGATGAASGWYHSLRKWTKEKWIPQRGGRQANPRVFVPPLFCSMVHDEAVRVARTSEGHRAFPDQQERRSLSQEKPWSITDSWNQHLVSMAQLHGIVDQRLDVVDRITNLKLELDGAIHLFDDLIDAGAAIDRSHRQRLVALSEALESFALAERL